MRSRVAAMSTFSCLWALFSVAVDKRRYSRGNRAHPRRPAHASVRTAPAPSLVGRKGKASAATRSDVFPAKRAGPFDVFVTLSHGDVSPAQVCIFHDSREGTYCRVICRLPPAFTSINHPRCDDGFFNFFFFFFFFFFFYFVFFFSFIFFYFFFFFFFFLFSSCFYIIFFSFFFFFWVLFFFFFLFWFCI